MNFAKMKVFPCEEGIPWWPNLKCNHFTAVIVAVNASDSHQYTNAGAAQLIITIIRTWLSQTDKFGFEFQLQLMPSEYYKFQAVSLQPRREKKIFMIALILCAVHATDQIPCLVCKPHHK